MHSYGGLVGSQAISKEWVYSRRQAMELPGGVIHLFMIPALILDSGESLLSEFGESPYCDVKVMYTLPRVN